MIVWAWFSAPETGPLKVIDRTMNSAFPRKFWRRISGHCGMKLKNTWFKEQDHDPKQTKSEWLKNPQ